MESWGGDEPEPLSARTAAWRSRCSPAAPPPCSALGGGRWWSSVGLRRRRGRLRRRRGGGRSALALGGRLVGGFVRWLVGGLVRSRPRRLLRLERLLPRLRRIVGDVPAPTLQDEGRRREETTNFAAADITLFEGRLGDALTDLEHSFAFEALVFVGRHSH